jgi:hypothetical protein
MKGFCTESCGWHSYFNLTSASVTTSYKFSWIGIPTCSGCIAQKTSPNGDSGLDAAVSVIGHELAEAASDPLLNAWKDANGDENADKCAWNFTNLQYSSGYYYNLPVGSMKYLVQSNWKIPDQACTMS